jgi:hypothetical protein
MSYCGVWRFAVVPDESLWCLEIRFIAWSVCVVSGDSLYYLKCECGVWRFTVVPDKSLWCLELRCIAWSVIVVSGDSLCCLKSQCGVWRFTVLPEESFWCLKIQRVTQHNCSCLQYQPNADSRSQRFLPRTPVPSLGNHKRHCSKKCRDFLCSAM